MKIEELQDIFWIAFFVFIILGGLTWGTVANFLGYGIISGLVSIPCSILVGYFVGGFFSYRRKEINGKQ